VLAYLVKDGKHEDAEEFLGLYLKAIDEELTELQTCISTHNPASAPRAEEFEGGAEFAEGPIEVRKRDDTVGKLLFLSLHCQT
jgi:hypothetical protein